MKVGKVIAVIGNGLVVIGACLIVYACATADPKPPVVVEVVKSNDVQQRCYNGVVYVQFGSGTSSWGGVMYNKDLKPVTC